MPRILAMSPNVVADSAGSPSSIATLRKTAIGLALLLHYFGEWKLPVGRDTAADPHAEGEGPLQLPQRNFNEKEGHELII